MPSSFSPQKNYELMATGEDVNTWGIKMNANLSLIDSNLGGTLNISVAGNSNINVTSTQASNLIHNLSGALTGNINYNFPADGGVYAIKNATSGSFSVTVTVQGGTGGIIVPQGTTSSIYIDASVPAVDGFTGTSSNFYGILDASSTANSLVINSTIPAAFSLQTGTFLTIFPTQINTSSVSITPPGGSPITVKKVTPSGLVNLVIGDLAAGIPLIGLYNGTNFINSVNLYFGSVSSVSTAQSVSFANLFVQYVNTAAVTYTISRSATTLAPYWYIDIDALGGNATITPDSNDSINVAGQTLSAGTSYVMPQGSSGRLYTDANGNLYVRFSGNRLNLEATLASTTTASLGGANSNIINITGTNTINSFGNTASVGLPFYITRFSGAVPLTFNSTSLILPGSTSYTTAIGDVFSWKFEGSGNWRCAGYALASGKSLVASSGGAFQDQIFTTTGTFTAPSTTLSTTKFKFIITGAGGGGGGGNSNGGGGGGGAATTTFFYTTLTASSTYTVTIGTGGLGSTNSTGSNGGTSSVLISTTITAPGGLGGGGNALNSPGGLGGGNGTNGTYYLPGGDGGCGMASNVADNSGNGGTSYWGGGGQGGQFNGLTTGQNGRAYGSGGGGSYSGAAGNGANGFVTVEWVL